MNHAFIFTTQMHATKCVVVSSLSCSSALVIFFLQASFDASVNVL